MKKTKTREEVAREYNISRRSLYRYFEEIGIDKKRGLLLPVHLMRIYRKWDFPKICRKRKKWPRKRTWKAECRAGVSHSVPNLPKTAQ